MEDHKKTIVKKKLSIFKSFKLYDFNFGDKDISEDDSDEDNNDPSKNIQII